MAVLVVTRGTLLYPNKYNAHHQAVTPKYRGYTQKGTSVSLIYEGELTSEEASNALTAEANYVDNDPYTYILDSILRPARAFGDQLIDEFAAENVLLGIDSMPGMTNQVRKVMGEVADALRTGSLKDAIWEARQIPPLSKDAIFVTNTRLLYFINKIETYLGLPLSTEL